MKNTWWQSMLIASVVAIVISAALTGCATSQPRAPVVVKEVQTIPAPSTFSQCQEFAPYSRERASCERGARQRELEEQRRRENDAYRRGYGR